MQFCRASFVLATVLLLVPGSAATTATLSVCTGYVTHHYDDQGNIVNTIISCAGDCGSGSCEDIEAGDFAWCQCSQGGGTGPCVTIMVDNPGTLEEGVRCADLSCTGTCEVQEVEYSNPETGHEFVESHCEC